MAHVLVADPDHGIREAIQTALEDEGHIVTSVATDHQALIHLRTSSGPLVALVNQRLGATGGLAILHMAADDCSGLLARHSYVLMSSLPNLLDPRERMFLSGMGASLLSHPFDLDDLLDTVSQLDRGAKLVAELACAPRKVPVTRRLSRP